MRQQPRQSLTLPLIRARCVECGTCWEFITGAKTEHHRRHAHAKHEGKQVIVRRLAYELANGPIKQGLRIVTTCGNPYCVNPAHQSALTESQKGKRAAENGAFASPARRHAVAQAARKRGKLTPEQAQEIRYSTESGPVLAEKYGINKSRINSIKRGEGWRDYSNPFAGLGAR